MQAVVLAAGFGTRLASVTGGGAKVLAQLHGQPLLAYSLRSLASAGVQDIVVVIGHAGDTVRAEVESAAPDGVTVRLVENPAPERGNGSSLFSALPHISEESFLLVMGDHLAAPGLLGELVDSGTNGWNLLAVDYRAWVPAQIEDATKVLIGDGGRIRAIGKTLRRFNAIDTGFFLLRTDSICRAEASMDDDAAIELGAVARGLVDDPAGLHGIDVSGSFWIDVDTPQDFALAAEIMRLSSDSPQVIWPVAAIN